MHTNIQAVNYGVGTNPTSVVIADLDKDGYPDIVTANHDANTISVLLGNAAGTFSPAPNSPYAVGTRPYSVAIADLNGDKHLDIVIANSGSNTVSVLLGNAAGTFAPAPNSPYAVGASPRSFVIADFNKDGYLDIVTANYNARTVSILFGNPAGIFSQSTSATYPVGTRPHSVAIGDLNKDGYLDVVTANDGSNSVSVLFGNLDGTFSHSSNTPYTVGARPLSVAIADLNKDGYLDIVTANYGADTVSVLLGNAAGTFSIASNSPYSVGGGPHSVAIADLNGDGHLDIAIANSGSNSVSVLLGNAAGIFSSSTNSPYSVGTYPHAVAIADLNNDGNLDVVTANYRSHTVSVLYGTIDGPFSQSMDKFVDKKLGQAVYDIAQLDKAMKEQKLELVTKDRNLEQAMHNITQLEQKIKDLKLELEMKDQDDQKLGVRLNTIDSKIKTREEEAAELREESRKLNEKLILHSSILESYQEQLSELQNINKGQDDVLNQYNSAFVQLQQQIKVMEQYSIICPFIIASALIIGAEKGPNLLTGAAIGALSGAAACVLMHSYDVIPKLIGDTKPKVHQQPTEEDL